MQLPVVVVTGASSGIGLATVVELAATHTVVAAMRDPEGAQDFQQALRDAPTRANIHAIALDVRDEALVEQRVQEILSRFGQIDVVVSNAGIGGNGSIEETATAIAREIFDTNYFGTLHVIRAVLPAMRRQRTGMIVYVSSLSSDFPIACLGHYAASKRAMEGMCQALSEEVAQFGIRVTVVAPGVTTTPMFTRRKYLRMVKADSPYLGHLKRLLQYFSWRLKSDPIDPAEVARAIDQVVRHRLPGFRFSVGTSDLLVRLRGGDHTPEWHMAAARDFVDRANHDFEQARGKK